ncbi:MAG: hypothetical protein J6Y79_00445 [Paludibacteraceae bacterium]|nr:hypothetical protein [Paludibacteraceae bacterium]
MVYRFLLLSDEIDDFAREISIDSEASFLDFHKAILASVGFSDNQMTSFFLCSDDWEKGQEITLVEMDTSSDYDNLTMEATVLRDCLDDRGQRLIYLFDPLGDRCFFIELKEILPSQSLNAPQCSYKTGNPPAQLLADDSPASSVRTIDDDLGENFYGDEGFNDDEFSDEEFSDLNDIPDPESF